MKFTVSQNLGYQKSGTKRSFAIVLIIGFAVLHFLIIASYLGGSLNNSTRWNQSSEDYQEKCENLHRKPSTPPRPAFDNPRGYSAPSILFKHCVIWDGLGNELYDYDILTKNGTIIRIAKDLSSSGNTCDFVVDVQLKLVTPGLVDMHSHAGVDTWPALHATNDVNEMTGPTQPQLNSKDGFNPADPGIYLVSAGGVSTSLILPGSGNIMGGEAFLIKNRKMRTVEEMSFNYGLSGSSRDSSFRYMKMALGENPKNVYGSSRVQTRMGLAWQLRSMFDKALKLKKDQDGWCSKASGGYAVVSDEFPEDLSLESLVALLRGHVKLNVHVYETHDMETLFRIASQFNVPVAAIHHATSAHLVAPFLRDLRNEKAELFGNLTVALFSDRGYYKYEAYKASFNAPSVLKEARVPFAFKSDHSVTNSQFLHYQAGKAVYYGISPHDAIQAVTSVPAKALGVDHRVGSVREGMDADLVVWNKNPFLQVGAIPDSVYIDGFPVYEKKIVGEATDLKTKSNVPSVDNDFCKTLEKNLKENSTFIKFTGLSWIHLNESTYLEFNKSGVAVVRLNDSFVDETGEITAKSASLVCFGSESSCPSHIYSNLVNFETSGGTLMPSPIALNSKLGSTEIDQESITNGLAVDEAIWDELIMDGGLSVASSLETGISDGYKYDLSYSKQLEIATRAGISFTMAIPAVPMDGVVMGKSALLRTAAFPGRAIFTGGIIKEETGIHLTIGKHVSGGLVSALQGQMNYIMQLFKRGIRKFSSRNVSGAGSSITYDFADVLTGKIPLFVHVDNAEQIAALLKVKVDAERELKEETGIVAKIKMVLVGGSEAYILAKELSAHNISVILSPLMSIPEDYESRRTRSYSSLDHPILTGKKLNLSQNLKTLRDHGVPIGIASHEVHEIFWDAAISREMSGQLLDGSDVSQKMSFHEAVGLVTWNAAKLICVKKENVGSIKVRKGGLNMVVFANGHPLQSFTSKMVFSFTTRGEESLGLSERMSKILCNPQQI